MRQLLILVLSACFSINMAYSQSEKDPIWEEFYEGSKDDQFFDLIQNSRGEIVSIGTTKSKSYRATDIIFKKLKVRGTPIEQFNIGGRWDDFAYAIIENSSGYLIAGGTQNDWKKSTGKNIDAWLVQLDYEGQIVEHHSFGDSNDDEFLDVVEINPDLFYAAGYMGEKPYLQSFDSDFKAIDQFILSKEKARYTSIALDEDNIYLAGTYDDAKLGSFLVIHNISTGNQKVQELNSLEEFVANDVFVNDEYLIVAGSAEMKKARKQAVLIAMDKSGENANSFDFGGRHREDGYNFIQLADGNYLFSGASKSYKGIKKSNFYKAVHYVLDPKLNLLEEKSYYVGSKKNDEAKAAIQSYDGDILVAGMNSGNAWIYQPFSQTIDTKVDLANLQISALEFQDENDKTLELDEYGTVTFTLTNNGSDLVNGARAHLKIADSDGVEGLDTVYVIALKPGQSRKYTIGVIGTNNIKTQTVTASLELSGGGKTTTETIGIPSTEPVSTELVFADVSSTAKVNPEGIGEIELVFNVMNKGNVPLEKLSVQCQPEAGLELIQMNASEVNLGIGESAELIMLLSTDKKNVNEVTNVRCVLSEEKYGLFVNHSVPVRVEEELASIASELKEVELKKMRELTSISLDNSKRMEEALSSLGDVDIKTLQNSIKERDLNPGMDSSVLIAQQKRIEEDKAATEKLKAELLKQEEEAKANAEAERLEKERLEAELAKREAEAKAKAEAEKLEKERLEAELLKREAEAKAKAEAERLEKEKLEKEIAEQEAKKEADRLEKERLEAELAKREAEAKAKAEAERLEKERLEAELAKKEAEAKAKAEAELLEKEKLEAELAKREAEAKAKVEAERLEKERLQAELKQKEEEAKEKAEAERIEKEKLEAELKKKEEEAKAKAEAERIEKERLEAELAKREAEAKEKAEAERLEKEKLEAELAKKEAEAKAKAEAERIEKEKLEAELAKREAQAKEKAEQERLAKEKAEQDRIEKERIEKELAEKERIQRELDAKELEEKKKLEEELAEKKRLEAEYAKQKAEAEAKAEAERLEKERLQAEIAKKEAEAKAKAEEERLEKERLEAEIAKKEAEAKAKAEAERLEKERLEAELAKKEAEAKAKAEAERLEKERLEAELAKQEAEAKAKAEAERKERERLEAEIAKKEAEAKAKAEEERLEKERLEAEIAKKEAEAIAKAEEERLEKERLEAELAKKEAEAKAKAEEERIAKEKLEAEIAKKQLEATAKAAEEKAEKERLEAELAKKEAEAKAKAEEERIAKEKLEAEIAQKEAEAKAKAEEERLAKEKLQAELAEQEKLAKEAEAQRLADKEKLEKEIAEKERLAKELAAKESEIADSKVNEQEELLKQVVKYSLRPLWNDKYFRASDNNSLSVLKPKQEISVFVTLASEVSLDYEDIHFLMDGTEIDPEELEIETMESDIGTDYIINYEANLKEGTTEFAFNVTKLGIERKLKNITYIYELPKPNLYILSIGVPDDSLQYTGKDAKDFASFYENSNMFSSVEKVVLSTEKETSYSSIQSNLSDFKRKNFKGDDVFILYISSHGYYSDKKQKLYIKPSDFDLLRPEQTFVNYYNLYSDIADIPCRKYIFLDVCYAGEVLNDGDVFEAQFSTATENIYNYVYQSEELDFAKIPQFLSCGQGQLSYEVKAKENSAFIQAFEDAENSKEAQKEMDADANGFVSMIELFSYVQTRVPKILKENKISAPTLQRPTTNAKGSVDFEVFRIEP